MDRRMKTPIIDRMIIWYRMEVRRLAPARVVSREVCARAAREPLLSVAELNLVTEPGRPRLIGRDHDLEGEHDGLRLVEAQVAQARVARAEMLAYSIGYAELEDVGDELKGAEERRLGPSRSARRAPRTAAGPRCCPAACENCQSRQFESCRSGRVASSSSD